MKLFRFDGGHIGIAQSDAASQGSPGNAYDITATIQAEMGLDIATWPPVQMVALIARLADDPVVAMQRLIEHPRTRSIDFASVRLDLPVEWPNKLLAFPANYRLHQLEMNSKNQSNVNGFFMKANTSLSGPNDPIVLPDLPGREIHHECEVGIVIGKGGRHIPRERAWEHIFGYACLIDVVIRGNEERVLRKSYDSFCPFGPWITTADEVPDPANLQARLWVNDELRQNANTRDLILDIPGMIELASRVATLIPGDIIATGTPEGVGPIRAGDKVRIAIDHLGEMTLDVKMEETADGTGK